jgi:hypothetical protein
LVPRGEARYIPTAPRGHATMPDLHALSFTRLVTVSWLTLLACDRETSERTREAVERSASQAREQIVEVGDEVAKTGREVVQSGREVGREVVASSREGLREAKQGLDRWFADRREQSDAAYQPIAGADAAIECDTDTHCTIDAAFVDRLAAQPTLLANEAIAVPREGTSATGLALDRVREGSIPALLGLRDGDLLISLNGTNLASLDAPAALADALAGTHEAKLVYERGTAQRTLVIERVRAK